jgi:hypothetical protein
LIDVGVGLLMFHEQSVRCYPLCFKGSPRYLALSFLIACASSRMA